MARVSSHSPPQRRISTPIAVIRPGMKSFSWVSRAMSSMRDLEQGCVAAEGVAASIASGVASRQGCGIQKGGDRPLRRLLPSIECFFQPRLLHFDDESLKRFQVNGREIY